MRRVPSIDLVLMVAAVLLLLGAVLLMVDLGHETAAIPLFTLGFAFVVVAERVRGRHVPSSQTSRPLRTRR